MSHRSGLGGESQGWRQEGLNTSMGTACPLGFRGDEQTTAMAAAGHDRVSW